MQKKTIDCDIFCDVIDNFGDAGVCWRLARDLQAEKGWRIHFYINDLKTLAAIEPKVRPFEEHQEVNGIEILKWVYAESAYPSEVVIETFGCRIPDAFEKKISEKKIAPIWINLEYFSAEDWIEGCHKLPSPHPLYGTKKYFFFPGVTSKSGGLICERALKGERECFEKSREAFFKKIGGDPKAPFTLFVFCYPSAPLKLLIGAFVQDERPIQLLLAAGKAGEEIKTLAQPFSNISCVSLHMVPQTEFDQLLWACDSLIVRGEDSFARAQLAAKPFIWNIYPQTEETHIKKLKAFADRLEPFYTEEDFDLWKNVNLAFNKGDSSFLQLWKKWRDRTQTLTKEAQVWRENLHSVGSLTENLCKFIESKLKS